MISCRAEVRIASILLTAVVVGGTLSAQDSKPLPSSSSPGQSIQDAARASLHNEPENRPNNIDILDGAEAKRGAVEVLTDTKGVDFGPYLRDISEDVRGNWYKRIPDDAQFKKGKLAIRLTILPDGRITAIKFDATSGDVSLDRAAWEAVTASTPLPPLPSAFNGPNLAVRFHFYYNPDKDDLAGMPTSTIDRIVHAVLAKNIEDSDLPKYPKKARKDKIEGVVRVDAKITPEGKVESVQIVEGSLLLEEAASKAICKWAFHPAMRAGKPVEDRLRINIEFHLDGARVSAQVVAP